LSAVYLKIEFNCRSREPPLAPGVCNSLTAPCGNVGTENQRSPALMSLDVKEEVAGECLVRPALILSGLSDTNTAGPTKALALEEEEGLPQNLMLTPTEEDPFLSKRASLILKSELYPHHSRARRLRQFPPCPHE
jgi:hypothetical protein